MIDFKELNDLLLIHAREKLSLWLPNGVIEGHEYKCGSTRGEPGRSLSININTGIWKDFASGEKGGDLISLFAAIEGISQKDAALRLKESIGIEPVKPTKPRKLDESSSLCAPPHNYSIIPDMKHSRFGKPSKYWTYRDEQGHVIFYMARYDHANGNKDFIPWSYTNDGRWVPKQQPEPRPLYNLDNLHKYADRKVLIVEGEKAADAANEMLPGYVAVTWPGGAQAYKKADWSQLKGRQVLLWPDADNAGREAMTGLIDLLRPICPEIKYLDVLGDDGFDAADALEGGWTQKEFVQFAKPIVKVIKEKLELLPVEVLNQLPEPQEKQVSISGFAQPCEDLYNISSGGKIVPNYQAFADKCYNANLFKFNDNIELIYKNNYWQKLDKVGFQNILCNMANGQLKPEHIDNFIKSAKTKCYLIESKFLDKTNKINLLNGIYDIKENKLYSHSSKYLFRNIVNVEYRKDADCPHWLAFLDDIFENNKELIEIMQRIFGYVVIGGEPFLQRAFLFYGTGGNGKSVVMDILREILGEGSYASISMSALDKPFSVVGLDGKLANIVEETPKQISAEHFKNIVSGGEVRAAYKGKDEYNFKNQARIIFACNELPQFDEKNHSIDRRIIIIPFNKQYSEELGNIDYGIKKKLISELSGIFNWAMEGARMVMKDQSIPEIQILKDLKHEFKIETDHIFAWFEECIEVHQDKELSFVSNQKLYESYEKWCQFNGHHMATQSTISKRVSKIISQKIMKRYSPVIKKSDKKTHKGHQILKVTENESYDHPLGGDWYKNKQSLLNK